MQTCERCDVTVVFEDQRLCYGCGTLAVVEEAHEDFRPLLTALRRLDFRVEIWRYEPTEFRLAVVLSGERVGLFGRFDPASRVRLDLVSGRWRWQLEHPTMAYHRENAESIARWAAPMLVRFDSATVDKGRPDGHHGGAK